MGFQFANVSIPNTIKASDVVTKLPDRVQISCSWLGNFLPHQRSWNWFGPWIVNSLVKVFRGTRAICYQEVARCENSHWCGSHEASHVCVGGRSKLNSHDISIGDGKLNPIVGVYIPIIRIPIKGGMTIPNIATFDHGTCGKKPVFFRDMLLRGFWLSCQLGNLFWCAFAFCTLVN